MDYSLTKDIINERLKRINTRSVGRNDLIHEVFLIVKEKLPNQFNIESLANALESAVYDIKTNHCCIRNNDNLIKDLIEIINIKNLFLNAFETNVNHGDDE